MLDLDELVMEASQMYFKVSCNNCMRVGVHACESLQYNGYRIMVKTDQIMQMIFLQHLMKLLLVI